MMTHWSVQPLRRETAPALWMIVVLAVSATVACGAAANRSRPAPPTTAAARPSSTARPAPPAPPAQPPQPLRPQGDPAGGPWTVLASSVGEPVVWGLSNSLVPDHPNVVASFAVFDPTRLRAALFNGTELPGGGPWTNGSKVTPALVPSLVAAFNGGFKFKDMQGGYFTEGRVVKPLLVGDATLAVSTTGRLTIGVYGTDLTNDGSWVSLRQNLPLVVDGGKEVVSIARERGNAHVYWGDNFGRVVLDLRSALCIRTDGLMMYAVVGSVDINGLASVLVGAHCNRAMELDINGRWPQFLTFDQPGRPSRTPIALDSRMAHLDRYLTVGSSKDFIAVFDPSVLPTDVVR